MTLYLIRHGQTDINKQNKMQGRHGLELNEEGIKQVSEVKKQLADIHFDYVFSSPQVRAIQTAQIATGIEPIIDQRLNVFDIGSAENLPLDKVQLVDNMIPDPSIYQGVEDRQEYLARIFGFAAELVGKYGKQNVNILVSGHSCTTGCLSAYFEGMPADGNFLTLATKNAGFKKYEI